MNKQERDESRKICEAATGDVVRLGHSKLPGVRTSVVGYDDPASGEGCVIIGDLISNDAEFYAHARTALPAALDRIDELEAERAKCKYAVVELWNALNYTLMQLGHNNVDGLGYCIE